MDCDNASMQSDQAPKEPPEVPAAAFPFQPVQLPSSPSPSAGDKEAGSTSTLSTPGVTSPQSTGQHRADRKAFKGRGERRRIAEATAAVDTIHDDMHKLAAATKSIKAKRLYLAIHVRSATGQMSLRWRRAGTTDTGHIAWEALDAFLAPLPPDLVQWYRNVNHMAISLNGDEKHARAVLRHLTERMQKMEANVAH